jgi:flagella basal body P-ring formation protein FlgA
MLALLTAAGCLALGASGDLVTAGDLARAFPPFAAAGTASAGFAPSPGVRRVFTLAELRRLAARWKVEPAPEREICVERQSAPPDPERFRAAMQAELPEAKIEILDHSRGAVPGGELAFPRAGLQRGPAGWIWRGYVAYAPGKRFPVWAKVRATVPAVRVVAARDLAAGHPIAAEDLAVETREEPPDGETYAAAAAEAEGKLPRRLLKAGTALRPDMLAAAPDVARGESVTVEVEAGAARLRLEGVAQAAGTKGRTIPVRNPESKKVFQAVVIGKGRVSVRALTRRETP